MIITRKTVLYFRHWYPRIANAFDKAVFSNSVHYGFFWLGVIRYR